MENNVVSLESNLKHKSQRNGLIELYRFLFAIWVVWFHSFFIFKNQYFNHGYISVDFFFILSGFYLIKAIDKYLNTTLFKGIGKFLLQKIKALGTPFFVGFIFAVWYMFLDDKLTLFGFLWYIPFMLLGFIVIFVMKKYIKSNRALIFCLIVSVVLNYLLYYNPFYQGIWLFGAVGGVSLGVLISFIPKINLKTKSINFNWIITLALLGVVLYLAYLPKENLVSEYFLVLLLMPMLIYFTNTLSINCRLFNFLGSLSFGLYAYQCVLRVIEYYIPLAQYWLFLILVGLVLVDKLVEHIYKRTKREKASLQPS